MLELADVDQRRWDDTRTSVVYRFRASASEAVPDALNEQKKASPIELFALCIGPDYRDRRMPTTYGTNIHSEIEQRATLIDCIEKLKEKGAALLGSLERRDIGGGITCESICGPEFCAYMIDTTDGMELLIAHGRRLYQQKGPPTYEWYEHILNRTLGPLPLKPSHLYTQLKLDSDCGLPGSAKHPVLNFYQCYNGYVDAVRDRLNVIFAAEEYIVSDVVIRMSEHQVLRAIGKSTKRRKNVFRDFQL